MAAAQEQPALPSISPRRIKRLIERLSYDNQFRTRFVEATQQAHGYANLRSVDPEFPGAFSHYYLALQYVLHDPRVSALYNQHYKNLADPNLLEYVCSQLATKEALMQDLDKGILFEQKDYEQIQKVIEQPEVPSQREEKITEVLTEVVKKKEAAKETEKPKVSSGEPAPGKSKEETKAAPSESKGPVASPQEKPALSTSSQPVEKSPAPSTPVPINPLSFRLRQVAAVLAPPLHNAAKRLSTASFLFYKKYPAVTKAAIGAAVGGVASGLMGWPGNPVSGVVVGAFAPEIIRRGFQIISPPPQAESDFEDGADYGEYETESDEGSQGASRPGGYSTFDEIESSYGQGSARPGGFNIPGRNMFNRARGVQRAAQLGRGVRSAATVARAAPLLANPVFWIVVAIILGILLLFFLLFIILPTTSLLPPFDAFPAGRNPSDQVQIIKSGPRQVANGEKIRYTIQVTNKGTGVASAEITDTIPNGTEYVDSTPQGTVSGRTVKWSLSNIQSSSPQTIVLEVQPTENDIWVINEVSAVVRGGAVPGGGPIGGNGCPDTSTNRDGFNCKYLNPSIGLFDTSITQEGIDRYVNTYGNRFVSAGKGDLNEFRRRVEYIVQQSQESGLNPAIFLGYWRSENAFGTLGSREFGCAGEGFYEEIHCALGIKEFSNPVKNPIANCARSKDANSQACQALKQMRASNGFDNEHPIQYPIATFDDFAEAHGPYNHLTGGLPTNCTNTYNILIDVSKEVGMCKPQSTAPSAPGGSTSAGPLGLTLSCPIEVAQISCGTAEQPTATCGHGGKGYGACSAPPYAVCPYSAQLRKAIDVVPAKGGNAPVYAPYINGTEVVEWTRIQEPIAINGGSWGYKVLYKATHQGKELILDLTHINAVVTPYATVKSGEAIGSVYPHTDGNGIGHLHTAISVNGVWVEPVTEAKMCGN